MFCNQSIPAPTAGVYTNGQAPVAAPVTRHAARQLRRIARELAPPRPHQRRKRRVLYRRNLSDIEVDIVVAEIGRDRVMAVLDRYTQPQFALAAE